MNKIEELEKIKKLKDNHILTQEEYEVEKYKILNEQTTEKKGKNKKKKAKIFFILTAIFAVITIIFVISYFDFHGNRWYEVVIRSEYSRREEYDKVWAINDFLFYSEFVTGGIAIVSLITGIIFKIKEK